MTIFALSGPILVSAIYEAFLDSRLLQYIHNEGVSLSVGERVRLLYVILCGNLDMNVIGRVEDVINGPWNRINGVTERGRCLLKGLRTNETPGRAVKVSETRLRTMLASQYSFGVAVGAPVVFFCAAFIVTLINNYSVLGDNDTSHALGQPTPQVYEARITNLLQHLVCGGWQYHT